MKFLVMGLPGSGKTTLAKPFAELIGAIHLNADEIRTRYDDWDFSALASYLIERERLHGKNSSWTRKSLKSTVSLWSWRER